MKEKYAVLISFALLFFFIIPAQAQDGTKFTVYGQVFNSSGSAINGITVSLTAGGSTISTATTNAEASNGSLVPGYFYFPTLPDGVSSGTSMTLSASYGGESASVTVPRAAAEPQLVNMNLAVQMPPAPPAGSSGGGGGGGGGVSAENYSNIEYKEKHDLFIFKDTTTSYMFTNDTNPIIYVNITGNTNAGEINVAVEVLRNTSSLVTTAAPGVVYKNINIWVGTSGFVSPKNIKESTIRFRVYNSWLKNNKISSSDIKLANWDGTKWVILETVEKAKDGTYTYFEAMTTNFAEFAITALKGSAVPTSIENETPESNVTAPPTLGKTWLPVVAVVLVAVILSAVYIFMLKTKVDAAYFNSLFSSLYDLIRSLKK